MNHNQRIAIFCLSIACIINSVHLYFVSRTIDYQIKINANNIKSINLLIDRVERLESQISWDKFHKDEGCHEE